jgi:PAS domain S-box-containing protein
MPPLTGVVGMYGTEIIRAARIACQEVNDQGGVLGRPLELVIEDDGSLPESAVAAAERLVDEHRCTAIIGNLLSNSRIAVAYRVAEPRRVPYLNFSFYEGSIISRYFFHFAAIPNQQIDHMISYMRTAYGGRMFFAGNNYEWPRGSIAAAKRALVAAGGEVVGEDYFPFGADAATIDGLLDGVAEAAPDVFVPYFAGADQIQLLTRFARRGLKTQMAVVMGHFDELMASSLPPEVREGFYSCSTYFMTVDTAANRRYRARLAAFPGVAGIWPQGDGVLTNFGEGAYVCVKAFAEAVNEAGRLDPEALVEALRTVSVDAPQGLVHMDPATHHATVNTYLARCGADGVFTVVETFGAIAPVLPDAYHHQRVGTGTTLEDDVRLHSRMLAQLSEAVLLVRSVDGVIIYNNAGAEKLFGYDGAELIGLPISRLDDPFGQDPAHSSVKMVRVLPRKGEWHGEIASARKDGTPFWRSVSAASFTHPFFGEVWLAMCRDVTEQKQTEAALRASESLTRQILDGLFGFVGLYTLDGRLVDVNESALRSAGLRREEVLGHLFWDTYWWNYDEGVQATLKSVLARAASGEVVRYEPTVRVLGGVLMTTDATFGPLRNTVGEITHILGFGVDITARKRAEFAAAESQAAFAVLAEVSPVGIFYTDPAGACLGVNRRWCEMTGLSAEEALGGGWSRGLPPNDRVRVERDWADAALAGRPFRSEHYFQRPDGTAILVLAEALEQRGSDGVVKGRIGVITDITAQRQRRVALDALIALPRAAGDDYFNQVAASLAETLGAEVGFVTTQRSDRWLMRMKGLYVDGHVRPPVDYALAGTPCERVIREHTRVVPCQLQREFPEFAMAVELSAESYAAMSLMDSQFSAVGVIGVMRRVPLADSEGLRATLALFATHVAVELERRRAEARFIGVFDYSADAIVMSDRDGRILQVNLAAEQMFGWTCAELVGQPIDMLIPTEEGNPHYGWRGQFLYPGVSRAVGGRRAELRAVRKGGAVFPVEIGFALIETEADVVVAATVRDISTRMMLEDQIRQSNKMESMGQLAAGITHDFNNLLTVINGVAEFVVEDLRDNAPALKKLATIRDAGARATSLTAQLLAFSRKQILRPSVVSLNRVVVEAEALLRRVLGEDVRFVLQMQADLAVVTLDVGQFQQVILNLALNSRDAMSKGGMLTIQTANVTFDEETGTPHAGIRPGHYVMLALLDTGIGMDEATQARIFEPFFTTKPPGQGTGLGLATVYGIVKQSGGEIRVQSKVGEGTAFRIYLPVTDATLVDDQARPAPAVSQGSECVLVVDDDAGVREVIRGMLEGAGYTVMVAGSDEEALRQMTDHRGPVHLLLTDVVMPGMGGWKLAEQIRVLRPEIKVLFTSGYTDNALLRRGVLNEGMHLISKPYLASELTRKVRDVLGS